MTLGIASYIKFWYSPKPPDTRNNAELQQRSCKKLLKKKTSKKLANNLQRTSNQLARYAKNLPKSEISSGVFHSSARQQPQQTSSYKIGGGGTRACALRFI